MTLGLAVIGLAVIGYIFYLGIRSILDKKADQHFNNTKDKNDD
jgi:hypothetical protein